jgi:adenylosuccinate synthase
MKAKVVIGAAFGDEGKGLMVDYFCRQAKDYPVVVRFNGGAQAGHTVVTPDGKRHVFHHFGSGTLAGAYTYLSKHFLVNPVAWKPEFQELDKKFRRCPILAVHPEAKVTTIYDMFVNQKLEESRTKRHGSCGMGVHETMLRHEKDWKLEVKNLAYSSPKDLKEHIAYCMSYSIGRLVREGLGTQENLEWMINVDRLDRFVNDCKTFAENITVDSDWSALNGREIIFEGAQGLLLDEENTRFFPHVTHSRTGLTNVMEIANNIELDQLDVVYVTRSYLTRHGAGDLPGEDSTLSFFDNTNFNNPWQQSLRFAPMDYELINRAIRDDLNDNASLDIDIKSVIAVTHADQRPFYRDFDLPVAYESHGPTHEDVMVWASRLAA